MFILIIGGRFGGGYVADKNQSITNAEYKAAKEKNIPVFTFVRSGVLSDHHLYGQNRKKEFLSNIDFPSIEKQAYALDIFAFIDEVRRSSTNNALEGFNSYQDIDNHLRKQWAGMFFDFLKSREVKSQIDATNHLIAGLSDSSNKLEALVKSLYRSSNESAADKEIESIEVIIAAEKFFDGFLDPFPGKMASAQLDYSRFKVQTLAAIDPDGKNMVEYLLVLGFFKFNPDKTYLYPTNLLGDAPFTFPFTLEELPHSKEERHFNTAIVKLTQQQRAEVFQRLLKKYAGSKPVSADRR